MTITTKLATFGALISTGLVFGPLMSAATHDAFAAESAKPVVVAYASATSAANVQAGGTNQATSPVASCAGQAWPYVARECLAAADGTPVRKVVRTITIAR